MPRQSRIWKRKQGGAYYCIFQRKQHNLGHDFKEAKKQFARLMAADVPKQNKSKTTLGEVVNSFLSDGEENKAPKTHELQKAYLDSFCDFVGRGRRVADLTGLNLAAWLKAQAWGTSTQTAARITLMACFNFGVKNKLLAESPLWGIKRGRFEKRERILQAEEKAKIKAAVKGAMRDFLFALEQTGARPFSEIAKITAEQVNWAEGSVTFEKHKTEHQGKTRTIYLAPALQQLMEKLARKHQTGPLFRTQHGGTWDRQNVCKQMRKIEARTGLKGLTAYCWRHTYITDCLAKGMSPTVIAELCGNSARTVMKFYSHLPQRRDALKEAARRAVSDPIDSLAVAKSD